MILQRLLLKSEYINKQPLNVCLTPETEKWLLSIAPIHFASKDSPTTFEEVKRQVFTYKKYHVFNGGSTDTIFSERKYQYAYRAWHDSIHILNDLDFTKESELKVAKLQEEIALNCGIKPKDAKILRLDLEAHIRYYYAKGEHPVNQLDLIRDCIKYGIYTTVNNKNKIYH